MQNPDKKITYKFTFFSIIWVLIVCCTALAQDSQQIRAIRQYYAEVTEKINNRTLYLRDININYEVIPAIGSPASRLNIYYDMIPVETEDTVHYDIKTIKIENYFQFAGNAIYEEYLYNTKGELLFYFAAKGFGDVFDPESVDWQYEESFYFWNNELVRVVYGQQGMDYPEGQDIKEGDVRLKQAEYFLNDVFSLVQVGT